MKYIKTYEKSDIEFLKKLKDYFLYQYNPHYYAIFKIDHIYYDVNMLDIKKEIDLNLSSLTPPINITKTINMSDDILTVALDRNLPKYKILYTSNDLQKIIDYFLDYIELQNSIYKYNL